MQTLGALATLGDNIPSQTLRCTMLRCGVGGIVMLLGMAALLLGTPEDGAGRKEWGKVFFFSMKTVKKK